MYKWIFTPFGMHIGIVEIGLGLLMGKVRQFLTELSACNRSVFSFQDNNFTLWIFTKLYMCIDIVEI